MKLVCLDRNTFLLLALILRQFGLSVARSGSDTREVSFFFESNIGYYKLLKEKLCDTIRNYNLEINWGGEIENKSPSGLVNFFIKRTSFFESDFHYIIKIYFSGYEILESGKIEQNNRWITLGQEAMMFSSYLINSKLSKKEKKVVNYVEHFEQNELVRDEYYSIEKALALMNME